MIDISGMLHGTVMAWIADKSFGFIRGDDGREYFCHYSQLPKEENYFCHVKKGQRVAFSPVQTEKGRYEAKNVVILAAYVNPRISGGTSAASVRLAK